MSTRMNKAAMLMAAIMMTVVSCTQSRSPKVEADTSRHRSVYYWKTTFELGEEEQAFLSSHEIDRIYLRMFDVDTKYYQATDSVGVIPVATALFNSAKPQGIEIVPTVFITLDALTHYEGREPELAALITKRVLNMCSYNDLGPVSEVQFDCDWTESTKVMFDRLCRAAGKTLHDKGILLSGTIRLHQVEQAEYPFDKGVLMLYNTGAIKNSSTRNSIISYDDVNTYLGVKSRVDRFLKAREKNCKVIDFAYPTFHWNVLFDNNRQFDGIVSEIDYDAYPLEAVEDGYVATEFFELKDAVIWAGETIRPEYSSFQEVMKVKELVGNTIGSTGSNIIYHLDMNNLSKYTENEIEDILR